MAEDALGMVQVIRDYLPVLGDPAAKAHISVVDEAFSHAGGAYRRIERVRNPRELPWPGPRGSFWTEAPEGCDLHYQVLCRSLEPLCEHYGWQGISDGSKIAHSNVRHGGVIPPISDEILAAIEKPARRLLELTRQFPAWGSEGHPAADVVAEEKVPLTLLDRFPATPAGHVGFLESVRDDVHFAAEAKRQQLERGYLNDTLASMIRGIKGRRRERNTVVIRSAGRSEGQRRRRSAT